MNLNEKTYLVYQIKGGDIFIVDKSLVDDSTVELKLGDMFTYNESKNKFSLIDHNTAQVKETLILCQMIYEKRRWYEFFKKQKLKQYVFRTMMKA